MQECYATISSAYRFSLQNGDSFYTLVCGVNGLMCAISASQHLDDCEALATQVRKNINIVNNNNILQYKFIYLF